MQKKRIHIAIAFVACLVCGACSHGDYTPKPYAYLRIDMPEHAYNLVDTLPAPFSFEVGSEVQLVVKKRAKREVWIDMDYPQWNGVVFLSYIHLNGADSLRGQTDTSAHLLEKHYPFASGVEEQGYEDRAHRVYGNVYELHGNRVASTCQFWVTDSSSHFLRGALFINEQPNNDSLAPVLNFIKEDMLHLIETLRWQE